MLFRSPAEGPPAPAEGPPDRLAAARAAILAAPDSEDAWGNLDVVLWDAPVAFPRRRFLEELAAALPRGARVEASRRIARALDDERDVEPAEAAWREVLAARPGDPEATHAIEALLSARAAFDDLATFLLRRAEAMTQAGEPPESIRAVRLRRAALLEQRLGKLDATAAELEAVLAASPDHEGALRYLADVHERRGHPDRAVEVLSRVAALASDVRTRAELQVRRARLMLLSGDPVSARGALDVALISSVPPSMDAIEVRVAVARSGGDVRELGDALESFATLVDHDPAIAADHLMEASQCATQCGDDEGALRRARLAARRAPTLASAQLFARGLEYRLRGAGTVEDGRATLEALRRIEDDLDADDMALRTFLYAEACEAAGEGPEALRMLEAVYSREEPQPLLALALAERRLKAQGLAEAVALFEIAVHGNLLGLRSPGEVAMTAAEAARRAADLDRALLFLNEAAKHAETHIPALRRTANILASRGDVGRARALLEGVAAAVVGDERAQVLAQLGRVLVASPGAALQREGRTILGQAIEAAAPGGLVRAQLVEKLTELGTPSVPPTEELPPPPPQAPEVGAPSAAAPVTLESSTDAGSGAVERAVSTVSEPVVGARKPKLDLVMEEEAPLVVEPSRPVLDLVLEPESLTGAAVAQPPVERGAVADADGTTDPQAIAAPQAPGPEPEPARPEPEPARPEPEPARPEPEPSPAVEVAASVPVVRSAPTPAVVSISDLEAVPEADAEERPPGSARMDVSISDLEAVPEADAEERPPGSAPMNVVDADIVELADLLEGPPSAPRASQTPETDPDPATRRFAEGAGDAEGPPQAPATPSSASSVDVATLQTPTETPTVEIAALPAASIAHLRALMLTVTQARTRVERTRARLDVARAWMAQGAPHEAEEPLREAMEEGSIEACEVLAEILERETGRARNLVEVRRRAVILAPGEPRHIEALAQAAELTGNTSHVKAVEHVLAAFDVSRGGSIAPPPLAAQRGQEGLLSVLQAPSRGPGGDAMALLWEGAQAVFARRAATYALNGVERLDVRGTSPLARLYGAATKVLGAPDVPVYVRRSRGQPQFQIGLMERATIILSGDFTDDSARVRMTLGAAISAALPENTLFFGLGAADARIVFTALVGAFGPPGSSDALDPASGPLAGAFVQTVPASNQARLREILDQARDIDFALLLEHARQSGRRTGLFLAGDFGVAARALVADLGRDPDELDAPGGLEQLCQDLPSLADLLSFALSPEYAEARWEPGAISSRRSR